MATKKSPTKKTLAKKTPAKRRAPKETADKFAEYKKDPQLLGPNRRIEQRVLRFINDARTPERLMELPPNHYEEDVPPGRARPYEEHPSPELDPIPLLDRDTAIELFCERDERSPIHGLARVAELEQAVGAAIFKQIFPILTAHFGGRSRGQWTTQGTVTVGTDTIVPRHAALLRTGCVLMIEGKCSSGDSRTWLWNPFDRKMETPPPAPPGNNLYCSGHSFLRDGRLLAYGGGGESNTPGPKNAAWIFDPTSNTWDPTRDAVTNAQSWGLEQRWYPTLMTLGDHRVLVASGDLDHLNGSCSLTAGSPMKMEIYDETTGRFSYVSTPGDKFFRPTYPGLHLLPDNNVFFAPVGFRNNSELAGGCLGNEDSSLMTLNGFNGAWSDVEPQDRTKGMSVLLLSCTPPYVRVMIVGGGNSLASRTYATIDLSTSSPAWGPDLQLPMRPGDAQPAERIHPNVVLLPDGSVLVAGGASVDQPCWLYDPSGSGWAEMDELNYQRRYHSFALLLPTAEVMACGGQSTTGQSTIEVFKPPYLFRGPQPVIDDVDPDPIHHGRDFVITTKQASAIARVTLVRPMAVTHQTDSEQRVIELRFAPGATDKTLTATAPSPTHPHGLAPRGWYMLFVIDNDGVPSRAKFVNLH